MKAPTQSLSDKSPFSLVNNYKYGYRHREDITNLPPGILIVGSKNVMSNVAERIQIRQGYALDGDTNETIGGIKSSFDWMTRGNDEKHLRAGFLTTAGNDGKLQYRYVDSDGVVTWRDLITGLSSVDFNFTTFWDTTESLRQTIFVNGASQVQLWNGATTTVSSSTAGTITKTGTDSWLDTGFYASSNKKIIIEGVEYTYTGGENTTTLTGVTPSAAGITVGAVVHQSVVTVANSSFTGVPSTFKNGLIATLNNQIFLGSLTSSALYISKVNSYTDYSFSSPRQSGEGAILILDSNLVAFMPQENYMYVSAGKDQWYNVNFQLQTSTAGVTYEQVNAERLKTGKQQGARSQAYVSHMKDYIVTVTNEPTIDMIGRMENYFGTPQTKNISDSIKLDFDEYDKAGGSIYYWRYYILVALPQEGLVLMYNIVTDSFESPQEIPVSRFYSVDGELYGHSSQTSESYRLFTGYADRVYSGFSGFPIQAVARFSYQSYGDRTRFKNADMLYVEGYINQNTTLNVALNYEIDGCTTTKTFQINGSDTQIVCIQKATGSLGKESLGKVKLGGSESPSLTGLPPKFRVEKTFSNTNFFESSVTFSVLGVDQRFELLAFGLNAGIAPEQEIKIRQ